MELSIIRLIRWTGIMHPTLTFLLRFSRDGFKFARFETLKITFVNVLFPIKSAPLTLLRLTESNVKVKRIFQSNKFLG